MRIMYSKRDAFCFVRHVEIPEVLGRMARRGSIAMELTQGMAPHPKITLGPALPVGVVGLGEVAEMWLTSTISPKEFIEKMNASAPKGVRILDAYECDGPVLNKNCTAGSYWLATRDFSKLQNAYDIIKEKFQPTVLLSIDLKDDGIYLSMSEPSQVSPGALVKALVEAELISGWADVCVARLSIGRWDEREQVVKDLFSEVRS